MLSIQNTHASTAGMISCIRQVSKVHVSIASHSAIHAVAIPQIAYPPNLNTLEKHMNKLMSSLIAASIVGAFSMSAIAAAPAAEKPAAAPHKASTTKKQTSHTEAKKSDAAAMPAEPAKK
jgi:hypothetical protein